MTPDHPQNLSDLHTQWTAVRQAHADEAGVARPAQALVLERYRPAALRYLARLAGDAHDAEDLFQEFAHRFLQGGFRAADPGRGRFRDYLKTALYRLVFDQKRRERLRTEPLKADTPEPATLEEPGAEEDTAFMEDWRRRLLDLAWEGLAQEEQETGRAICLLLRLHGEAPDLASHEMAERLGALRGQAVSSQWVRKWLPRVQERFAELLLDEVARSLEDDGLDALAAELAELRLLDLCGAALERRRESILWR